MREYIDSLELCSGPKAEKEWRDIISADIADVISQDPDADVVDIDDAIQQLDADGFICGPQSDIPGIREMWVSFYLQNGTQDGATLYAKDINDAEKQLKEEYEDDFGGIADYGYYEEEV